MKLLNKLSSFSLFFLLAIVNFVLANNISDIPLNSVQNLSAITPNNTVVADDGVANDFFGGAVSVHGTRILVGAESNSEVANLAGAAYVYEFDGISWIQVDKLVANDAVAFAYFGGSVALWGDVAMVGARGDDGLKGAVYVFEYNGVDWIQIDKLIASDAGSGDEFGTSLSLQANRVIIGSPRDDDNAFNSGAVYEFEYDGNVWNETDKLHPDGAVFEEFFGFSVSLDNDQVLVGAYNSTNPNAGNARTGTAYVFANDGVNWNQTGKLYASDGLANTLFGYSVSISGDNILIGAHNTNIVTGAAYLYSYNSNTNTWGSEVILTSNDLEQEDAFGISVSLNNNRALIGAYRSDNVNLVDSGAVYVFDFNGTNWIESLKLSDATGAVNDFFGRSVAMTNSWYLAGATGANSDKGIVHVYLDDPVYQDGFE